MGKKGERLAVHRPADRTGGAIASAHRVRRNARLRGGQLRHHGSARIAAVAHQLASPLRIDAEPAGQRARLRAVFADGLCRRPVSADRRRDRRGGAGTRGRAARGSLRCGRHASYLQAEARPPGATARRRPRWRRSPTVWREPICRTYPRIPGRISAMSTTTCCVSTRRSTCLSLTTMALACVGLYVGFKRSGWL